MTVSWWDVLFTFGGLAAVAWWASSADFDEDEPDYKEDKDK